jgi:hypothetical protein
MKNFDARFTVFVLSESGCPYNLKNLNKEIQNRLTESYNDLNSSGYKTDDTNSINEVAINKPAGKKNIINTNLNKKRGRPFKNLEEKNNKQSQELERLS